MNLNAEFDQRAVVHADASDWVASPVAGVSRKMLDRVGGEVARATSIVRYAPGSRFSRHRHGGGEEFLVLDGVFQDEHGDYPAGAYLRNPPHSSHAPGAAAGCTILVKLWQFDADDRRPLRLNAADVALQTIASRRGVRVQPLFVDMQENVRIETWAAGARISYVPTGGIELFVLDGSIEASVSPDPAGAGSTGIERLRLWSWLRLPSGALLEATAGPAGARLWIKEGRLTPDIIARSLAALEIA